jgi:NAD(P)-dependent dehydrogenase (short-subunit alcohol dehydrogenase family)
MDFDEARRSVDAHLWTLLQARAHVLEAVRPGGTLLFIGGTAGRAPAAGPVVTTLAAGLPALTKNLALELAPIRVNLIAAGLVDTPLSSAILGDQLDARREQLGTTLC